MSQAILRPPANPDVASRRGVLEGIVHQVFQDMAHGLFIRPHRDWCLVRGAWSETGAWCVVRGAWSGALPGRSLGIASLLAEGRLASYHSPLTTPPLTTPTAIAS